MVVVFDMNLGYILQSVGYISYSYGLMLCITFDYVVLKTRYNGFNVVLCSFSVVIYDIICCIVLYIVLCYVLYNVIWCIVLFIVYGF